MEIVYVYTKKRSEFGRQALLSDSSAQLTINIEPDDSLRDNFIEKDPVDMAVQYAPEMTEHEVTKISILTSHSKSCTFLFADQHRAL